MSEVQVYEEVHVRTKIGTKLWIRKGLIYRLKADLESDTIPHGFLLMATESEKPMYFAQTVAVLVEGTGAKVYVDMSYLELEGRLPWFQEFLYLWLNIIPRRFRIPIY